MQHSIKIQNAVSEMVPPGSTETQATLAVSTTAVSFAANNLPATCKYVRLQVQGADVRLTYDGSAPTSSVGEYVSALEKTVLPLITVLKMKFIRAGGTDAVVWAQGFNSLAQ